MMYFNSSKFGLHNTNVEIIVRMAEDLDLPDLNGSSLYPAFL